MKHISVVTTIYNDEDLIQPFIEKNYFSPTVSEIVIVNTSSAPKTQDIPNKNIRCIYRPGLSRAQGLNLGATLASEPNLLFCHVDCFLPSNFDQMMRKPLELSRKVYVFQKKYQTDIFILQLQEKYLNLVNILFKKSIVGTNGLLIAKQSFVDIGMFPELIFLEDVEMIKKIKQKFSVEVFHEKILVSDRGYKSSPYLKILRNMWIYALYIVGFSPINLKKFYR